MEPVAFGKYLLVERLAQGGMAEVYRAVYQAGEGVEKTVALKRILPGLDSAREFIDMFIDEARIASSLTHVNVAQVFDFGVVDGSYYLAMELVDGVDLGRLHEAARRRAREGGRARPIPPEIAAFVIAEAARGLGYAHDKRGARGALLGIVHRDVSPQNILISYAGEVKIADFGIAKAVGKLHKTESGAVLGKLRYMSPEQVAGEPLDARSDLFSLGIILWELLAGAQLFNGDNPGQVVEQVKSLEIVPPSRRAPDVPPSLDAVCMRALERGRDQRYAKASEMARELGGALADLAPRLHREDVAAFVAQILPRGEDLGVDVEAATESRSPPVMSLGPPVENAPAPAETRIGHRRAKPRSWAIPVAVTAALGGTLAVALWPREPTPFVATLPEVSPNPSSSPLAIAAPPSVSAAERARLLAALESLPQAAAAWRGVQAEDYLAILSAVDASLCATAPAVREPSFPADALDRLERRKVTEEARALGRFVLSTGELPERVRLSLASFLRARPAYSPGSSGWSLAGLAVLQKPDDARHLQDLVRQQGALRRWREGRADARFLLQCERKAAVEALAARAPGPFADSLQRFLRAAPLDEAVTVDEHGLRYAVFAAERDEGAQLLRVRVRVTNLSAEERAPGLESARLVGLDAAPSLDPPSGKLGAGLVRELVLTFSPVSDAIADAAVLRVQGGVELQVYSEVLR